MSKLNAPAVVVLKLDQRTLPATITRRYIKTFISKAHLEAKAHAAWNNFGKSGREPVKISHVFSTIARENAWTPHLKAAQLSTHWADVVGQANAAHTQVVSFKDGELIIRATSTTWLTQLQYMIPHLKKTISSHLAPVEVTNIIVKGPNSYTFKRGKYSVKGRGPRDTWG